MTEVLATLGAMDRARDFQLLDDDRDQIVVMRDVSWKVYETLLDARAKSQPRMAYLDGLLELMATSGRHESVKTMLARLLEAYAEVHEISANGYGHTTYRKKLKKAGLEADECYFIGAIKKIPDLAIEVTVSHGSVDKLEIYQRLGVREVWFWKADVISVHRLMHDRFVKVDDSVAIPGIDLHEIAQILLELDESRQTETVRAYRESLVTRQAEAETSHRKRAIPRPAHRPRRRS